MALSNKKNSKAAKAASASKTKRKEKETVPAPEPEVQDPAPLPADAPSAPASKPEANSTTSNEKVEETNKTEVINVDEDKDNAVEEVSNEDKAEKQGEAEEAADEDEDDVISVDWSDINTEVNTGTKGFINNHWEGMFPDPQGKVAKLFANTSKADQVNQIELLITVNPDRTPPILLNDFTDVFSPFVVAVPGMGRHLKVVYNLQRASAHDLFIDTPLESELVCLSGDYIEGIQLPTTLVLPMEGLDCKKVKIAVGEEFNKKRLNPTVTTQTWFAASKLDGEALVPSIMPVPAFLLYDAFNKEIDAMVLYECWMTARTHNIGAFPKFNAIFRAFLKAQVVTLTTKDPQTRLQQKSFIQAAPSIVNDWKKHVLQFLFHNNNGDEKQVRISKKVPTVINSNVEGNLPAEATSAQQVQPPSTSTQHQPTTPAPTNLPTGLPTQQNHTVAPPTTSPPQQSNPNQAVLSQQLKDMTMEQLIAVVSTTTRTTLKEAKAAGSDDNNEDDSQENLGMCKMSYERLLVMCGLTSGEEDAIPGLWKKLGSKKMKGPMKKSIIKQWIEQHEVYQDAKVIIYSPLVTMIQTRDFEEDTLRSSRKSAAKGLTPFAVPSLLDKEVDIINDHAEAVESASQTTVKDMSSKAIEAEGPKSFSQLTKLIRRFANLIFALFGEGCPLYSELVLLISSFDSYGDEAIQTMSVRSMVTITWLVHRQARHFAAGRMDGGPKSLLPEFSIMCLNVQAKQPVFYGDVPSEMYTSATDLAGGVILNANGKRGSPTNDPPNTFTKKPKIKQLPHYNNLIKEKMSVFSSRDKLPRIKALCDAAGCRTKELFPKELFPENFCQKSALFGTCFADCRREHSPVTDDQARHILTKLKKAIDEPNLVKVTT